MSLHKTIADAVKTQIEAISGAPTVVLRDRVVKLEEDTLPLVIIVMDRERLQDGYALGGSSWRAYIMYIAVYYAQNQLIQTGIDDARLFRQSIRQRLIPSAPTSPPVLSGVSQVWNIDELDSPPAREDVTEANYEEATLTMAFYTNETTHI